jgi:serine/threonine protein kinase/chitodextrinase
MVWTIEGYQPLAELARSSTGVVLGARDAATGTPVVIKYLSQAVCAMPGFLVRFRGEIAVIGGMGNPNVADVYELVERPGQAAVVSEFVRGVSLRDAIAQSGRLEPQEACYVTMCVLMGLSELHGRGIVHRMLRPENVMLDTAATVKIVDVGLLSPTLGGTPANPVYAAPELWAGAEPSTTSDVYAAAAMFFECLDGRPPRGTGGADLGRSRQPAEAAVGSLPPERAPQQLRMLLLLGLALDARSRPADANAILQQLDVVALSAFGPDWYLNGQEMLWRRLSRMQVPVLVERSMVGQTQQAAPNGGPAAPRLRGVPVSAPPVQLDPTRTGSLPSWPPNGYAESGNGHGPNGGYSVTDTMTGYRAGFDGTEVLTPVPPPPPLTSPRGSGAGWEPPPSWAHRSERGRRKPLLIAALTALLVLGTGLVLVTMLGKKGPAAAPPVAENSHVPVTESAPAVPTAAPTGPGADTVKPSVPAGLKVTGRAVEAITLVWANSTDNVKVTGYIILRNTVQVGTSFTPSYADTGLTANTKYRYAVESFDAAGNISAASAPITTSTLAAPDTAAPSRVTDLHSTGQSDTTIALAWSAATDNVGVAGYEIYRGGVHVANVSTPGYLDTALTPATQYSYTVRSYDASNNASADSNTATAKTLKAPDKQAPTVPTGVSAAATSSTTIDVSWSASTDNVGVTSYLVFRGSTQVAEVTTGTAYSDVGLTPSTLYKYSVAAKDAAGNVSAASTPPASATTQPAPTTPPPTTEPPTTAPAPQILSVTLHLSQIGCTETVSATVVASGPMDVQLDFNVTGHGAGSVPLSFTTGNLSQDVPLASDGDATIDGSASANAGGQSDAQNWTACITDPPTT